MIYNIILIGAGYWGKNFVRLLNDMKDMYDFAGVVELNTEIQNKIKIQYPNLKIFTDYKNTFDLADIYLIATPVFTHYEIAKTCLENDKHIIVEKPLTNSIANSKKLFKIARENNRRIFVNFTPLYTDPYNYICKRYENKKNEIFFININRCNLGIIRNDCNVVEDLTCHDIAMLIYFLDDMPNKSSIKCSGKRCYSDNIDMISIQMIFPKNNILCNLYTSWVDNEKKREFSIISKNEKLIYNDIKNIKSIKINSSHIEKITKDEIKYNFGDEIIPVQKYNEPIRNQMEHYYNCLKDNLPCKTDGEFALKVNEILEIINSKIIKY